MATQADRRALHAYVSGGAHEQWHQFAAEQGVSVSATLEALANHVIGSGNNDAPDMNAVMDSVVLSARKIDAQRRRRRTKS